MLDLAVVGGGPGGYVAAIKAAQAGLKVALVERENLGGVCLNWGCIPSKNLIHQAKMVSHLGELAEIGAATVTGTVNYAIMQEKSRDVVNQLTAGVAGLMKKNKVSVYKASASLTTPNELVLSNGERITAKNIILATGSTPTGLKDFPFDEKVVLSSTGILAQKHLPKRLAIIGAGAIGCEFAYIMSKLGVDVSLFEAQDQILPLEDKDISKALADHFESTGVTVATGRTVMASSITEAGVVLSVSHQGESSQQDFDQVLVVVGRRPNSGELGLESVGVDTEASGHIKTNESGQTSVANVYAIGDVTNSPALAHVAIYEAELVIDRILGKRELAPLDSSLVPAAIYCEPQVASVGDSEQQARDAGREIKVAKFSLSGAGKSIAVGQPFGFVKLITDKQTDELIGAHIIGKDASEMINQLVLAKTAELLPVDIASSVFAHPTISESIAEAARAVIDRPIHN